MSSRAQQIFELYEQQVPSDEIARRFDTEVFEVHRIIYRVCKRLRREAAALADLREVVV